ncbi:hypothetical protein PI124_g18437 [Phytophthora idaei]|nr:hypothetical protein PI125_g19106 [Phytophthora idaei]KAG3136880.1 hypothetical protein PI126_g17631 [Phytophthora idaei]KAG3236555.1 hypothetical protein PI124_g18437 [Phytophthora idaei]
MLHSPPRSSERRREEPRVAPNYQALGQANALGIGDVEGRHRYGSERRDLAVEQRDHRRAGRSPPRYGARYPRDRQEEQGRRAGTVDCVRGEEAASSKLLSRLLRRVDQMEQENAKLRHRVDRWDAGSWNQRRWG